MTDEERQRFQEFINTNFNNGFNIIKGNNISFEDRVKIIKYISHHNEIKYTCIV